MFCTNNSLPPRVFTAVALITATAVPLTLCAQSNQPGQYVIKSQTVMPHLDEMRRITKSETVCIDGSNDLDFFPVFRQPGLKSCVLKPVGEPENIHKYSLTCPGNNGASGVAFITSTIGNFDGQVSAKLGGKNMTFTQFVDGTRVGECETAGEE